MITRKTVFFIERLTMRNKIRSFLGAVVRKFFPSFQFYTWLVRLGGVFQEVVIGGKKILVDLRDEGVSYSLFFTKTWEPDETSLLLKHLKKGMTFVDIGANIGYYTLLASEAVGENGKVVAFEPDFRNSEILRKNVSRNHCHNVVIENQAVTETTKSLWLYHSKSTYGNHRIYEVSDHAMSNIGDGHLRLQVSGVDLDSYFKDRSSRVDVIKMDIEGAEYWALGGMKRILTENRDIMVLTEFWPEGMVQAHCSPNLFLRQVRQLGFIIHRFTNGALQPVDDDEILRVVKGLKGQNLVLSRDRL